MKRSYYIALMIGLFCLGSLSGQDRRGDKLFRSEDYKGALNSYLKSYEKQGHDPKLAEKIALCYLELKDYLIASEYYKDAHELEPDNEDFYIEYVQCLIYAMEIDRAELEIQGLLIKFPDSKKAIELKETCSMIRSWEEIKEEYVVISLKNLNSAFDDFGPSVYKDNLVFTSNRQQDLKDFQGVDSKKDRLSNMYFAEFDNNEKTAFEKPKVYFKWLDDNNNHGPLSFTKFGKVAYFNSTGLYAQRMGKKLTMKVFRVENKLGEWQEAESISINNNSYSIFHPFINEDESVLFFASDRPGGYGGLDLYYSTKESGVWGSPKNLGPKINSEGDEIFPSYFNNVFYYSSNGRSSYGGFDLYESDSYLNPMIIKNMGYPINSSSDDFAIYFRNKKEGYFTSDRPGGEGGDDIFAFVKQEIDKEKTVVRGVVAFDKAPIKKAKVDLLDQSKNVLQSSITDESGVFQFNNVGVHSLYELKIEMQGAGINEDYQYHLVNKRGDKVVVIFPNEDDEYLFEALPTEDFEKLKPIETNGSLLSVDLRGQIYKDVRGDINERVTLYVLNPNNQVMARGYTDNEGNFEFKELPPEDYYTLRPDVKIPGVQIVIMDNNDDVVVLSPPASGDDFLYVRLSPDEDYITLMNEDGFPVKIKWNESFKIQNIYYATNEFDLNDAARLELEKLAQIMLNNEQLVIKLLSHTDSRDSKENNQKLSQKRAERARAFLLEKGIDATRVIAIGMGEDQLVNHCSDGVQCTEEEHAVNRRTEFEIIKN